MPGASRVDAKMSKQRIDVGCDFAVIHSESVKYLYRRGEVIRVCVCVCTPS